MSDKDTESKGSTRRKAPHPGANITVGSRVKSRHGGKFGTVIGAAARKRFKVKVDGTNKIDEYVSNQLIRVTTVAQSVVVETVLEEEEVDDDSWEDEAKAINGELEDDILEAPDRTHEDNQEYARDYAVFADMNNDDLESVAELTAKGLDFDVSAFEEINKNDDFKKLWKSMSKEQRLAARAFDTASTLT